MKTATQKENSPKSYCSKENISFCILMGAATLAGLWVLSGLLVAFVV